MEPQRRRWRRRTAGLVGTVALVAAFGVALPSAQAAGGRPNFKMPFRCGQVWKGETRYPATHNPPHSIDWNHYAADGSTDDLKRRVLASARGTVVESYRSSGGYGNTIVIRHINGWKTRYAHLYSRGVHKNDKVRRGQRIGRVGKTSDVSISPHLHYEQIHHNRVVVAVVQGVRWPNGAEHNQKSRNCR